MLILIMAVDIKSKFFLNETDTVSSVFSTPGVLISVIIKNIYVIAGIILFFMIIISGLGIILNAGKPDSQKQSSNTLTSALIGFVIIFISYWIIRIIELLTGLKILNP